MSSKICIIREWFPTKSWRRLQNIVLNLKRTQLIYDEVLPIFFSWRDASLFIYGEMTSKRRQASSMHRSVCIVYIYLRTNGICYCIRYILIKLIRKASRFELSTFSIPFGRFFYGCVHIRTAICSWTINCNQLRGHFSSRCSCNCEADVTQLRENRE